jgi:hypothetical protein
VSKIGVGSFVQHDSVCSRLKTGEIISCFDGGVVKIKTSNGDIFSCSLEGLRKISKKEHENRDALQKLRA